MLKFEYYFIAYRVKNGELKVEYCPTGEMLADFFTKPLQGKLFIKLQSQILNLHDE